MCANQMCSSAFTTALPIRRHMDRPMYIKVIMAFTEAFQEALDMRRAASRRYLGDE